MAIPKHVQLALVAFFIQASVPVLAAGPPLPPAAVDVVLLTGWLHVEDYDFDDATVDVVVNGEVRSAPVSKSGRVDIALPEGVEAVLRFQHPGHLTKEVLVDTRHSREGEVGKHKRHVRFAVILEEERFNRGLAYSGPVGDLKFEKDGGCLAVQHTLQLVPGRKNKPMVF